jgi:chromosome partitioning protein
MIVCIANQKGGVGKTTLATNLAVVLSNKGSVVLVDADDQQSAVKWNNRRTENKIDTEHHKGDLKKVL